MFHLSLWLLLVLCWVHTTPTVDAWGKDGHQMVANIAWSRLSNETQAWVRSILMADTNTSSSSSSTGSLDSPLADVANWADTVRYSKFYHWSTPLHYVDIQDDQIDGGCPVVNPPAGREEEHQGVESTILSLRQQFLYSSSIGRFYIVNQILNI